MKVRYFRYETLKEQDRPGRPDSLKVVEITKGEYNIRIGNRTHCITCGKKKKSNQGKYCNPCKPSYMPPNYPQ